MPKYKIYASFSVSMLEDIEADSPREAARKFAKFPSIPCGADFELEDTAPLAVRVLDPDTGDTLHEEL